MKNILKLIIVMMVAYGNTYAQNKGFELIGDIVGLKDGSNIYLLKGKDTLSTTKSKGSKFTLTGYIKGEANYYFLKLDTSIQKKASNALWLVNGKLSLVGTLLDWGGLILVGSEPHKEYLAFMALHNEVKGKVNENAAYKDFIDRHTNSLYVPELLIKMKGRILVSGMKNAYGNLTERAKRSYYGVKLKEEIDGEKIAAQIKNTASQNKIIPNFNLTTIDGKQIEILDIAAGAKYTLIDIWASWCAPCRAAIPELRRVYNDFHKKGFNIIGMSTDKNEVSWKKALDEDKTPWNHGLDNISYASKNIFAVRGIPGYILIDQKGRIVQSDLVSIADKQVIYKDASIKRLSHNLYEIIEGLLKK